MSDDEIRRAQWYYLRIRGVFEHYDGAEYSDLAFGQSEHPTRFAEHLLESLILVATCTYKGED